MIERAYSEVNLLQDYLEKPKGFGSWVKSLFQTEEVRLHMSLPTRCFLKLKLFCEDIELYEELELSFDELVELLLEDLVEFSVKSNNPLVLYKHFKSLSKLPLAVSAPLHKQENFSIKIDRKLIFRLEMLLADIAETEQEHPYTVEQILTLCLLSFLTETFRGGGEKIRKSIIRRLK